MRKRGVMDWKKWSLAIVASLVFHLLSYQASPLLFQFPALQALENESIEIEMLPKLEPEEEQFVEVNENAPENIPDDTQNYSFQDQQAASPEPAALSTKNLAEIEGEEKAHKIVKGRVQEEIPQETTGLFENIEDSKVEIPVEGAPSFIQPKVSEQLPIEKGEGEGVFAEATEGKEEETEKTEKVIDITPVETDLPESINAIALQNTPQVAPKPKPRPRLDLTKITGPIRNSSVSTSRQGKVSIDARFSQFGEYKQRMFEAIVYQWHKLADRITLGAKDLPSEVEIHFYVTSDGEIIDLKQTRSTSSILASFICEDAIKSRAPYGQWTDDMVKTLGDKTEVTITFNYR